MATIKDNNYITIFGWMRNRLHLKGTDLLVYAAIYGFTQDGENEYTATPEWLAVFIGVSDKSVRRAFAKLTEVGYVEKIERNSATGKTNAYKTIPLEKIDQDRVDKMSTPLGQFDRPPLDKMSTPLGQFDHPIYNSISNDNSNSYKNERKNEEETSSIPTGACAIDFSSMTDEQFVDWWDEYSKKPCDFEEFFPVLEAYTEESKRRAKNYKGGGQWKGKIVLTDTGGIERLKSYKEIIAEWEFDKPLCNAIFDFIKHCNAAGRFVTNAKLNDLCDRLFDAFEDDSDRIDALETAIRKGYFDIKQVSGLETHLRLSRLRERAEAVE